MSTTREEFARLAARGDDEIDLAEGALLIAAEACPDLDVAHHLGRLDALAEQARPRLQGAGPGAAERLAQLNGFLFEEQGFVGNRSVYDDPRNSYLNEVLERRTGIPITLAVLHIEVARRLGLRVEGVNFPGHFLARHVGESALLIDAFEGRFVTAEECAVRLRATLGDDATLERHHLARATPKQILARILRNLKNIHARAGELDTALGCCDRILLLLPDDPSELRNRGLVYEGLEAFTAARADFERFLELAPDDPSAPAVHTRLQRIRQKVAQLN